MKKSNLKASTLKKVLSLLIVIIISASAAGFYFIQDWFNSIATEISKSTVVSPNDDSSPQALKQVREEIAENQPAADKANLMIASSSNYKSSIVNDLKKYASASGLSVSKYEWTSNQPSVTGLSGVNTAHVTVTLSNPTSINNLLEFLRYTELSTPKLQVTGLNITKPADPQDPNQVNVSPIVIEVYIK